MAESESSLCDMKDSVVGKNKPPPFLSFDDVDEVRVTGKRAKK